VKPRHGLNKKTVTVNVTKTVTVNVTSNVTVATNHTKGRGKGELRDREK
jgi:hypothetical protein